MALVALALVVVLPSAAWSAGPTNVSGTVSSNTTWTLANSPYVMTGNVTVATGVTLTVEPGVVVKGDAPLRLLQVNGTLSAVGTASNPITFTSTADSAPGQWWGVHFGSGSGSSTLAHVNVRNGGTNFSGQVMVRATGGSLTIADSSITRSSGMGLELFGSASGTSTSGQISRTKFEANVGTGAKVFSARADISDSAFWANGTHGLQVWVATGYTAAPTTVVGTSIWGNGDRGVQISQDADVGAMGPDGSGNAIYDNGTFGFSVSETWNQLTVSRKSLSVDWSSNYWGPVRFIPCSVGSDNGHLSYGAPDRDPGANFPVERGPVSASFEYEGSGNNITWCGNDHLLVATPLLTQPDLYFDPPAATFGGIRTEQTRGCVCPDDPQLALAQDAAGGNALAYTALPVNTASGSLTEVATDLKLAGPGTPINWTRTYNSQDTASGPLGVGWTHPYGGSLTVVNPTTGELEYLAGTGQRTRFTKVSGGSSGSATYRAKAFDGTLKRLSDNTYELVTRDRRTFRFDTAGLLTQIKPRFLPASTLAYTSGKLSSITDSAGRTISITYNASTPALIERVTLPDGRYVEYGYTSGLLTSVRNPRGKIWTLAYDASNRLKSIQDPVGRYQLQDVVYDAQGRVTSEEDGAGEALTYAYSNSGVYSLTTVTPAGRGSTVYKHLNNLLISVIDPLNRVTSYTYDGQGRKASETDARGNTRRFEYDAVGNLVREIAPSPAGFTIERTFNATNDILSEKDGRGNTTTYAYATSSDAATDYQVGQLKTVTDRESGVSTFKYWTTTSSPTPPATHVGLSKSTTNERGKTTSFAYDTAGDLTGITTPLGLKTTMGYDGSGRLTSRRDPRGNVPNPPAGYLSEWTYTATDQVATATDARDNVTTFDYFDNELLWKTTRTDRGGTPRVTTLEYDSANRLWKTTDSRGGVETRLYWPDGLLKSVESAAGRKTSYEYDTAGQLWKLVEPKGNAVGATAADYTWTYGYDLAGNLTTQSHPDGGERETFYDVLDRPYQWDDALEHRTSVAYDNNGNVTGRTNALGKTRTYTYDKLDRLLTETDERSKTTTREYFPNGQLKSVTSPLGHKTSYGIDDAGRVTSMVEARGNAPGATAADYTWTYVYDEADNRTAVTDPLGNQVEYAYDAVNNLEQVEDQRGNATDYTFDVLNRLWKVTPPAAGATGTLYTEHVYDAGGNLATRTDPNGHATTWAYDLDGKLSSRTTPVGTWNFVYDPNGNLTALETPAGSSTGTAGDGTISYGYDRMNRQTSVDHSDATPDITRTYDLAGRPATMLDGSGTVTYTHDDANRLTSIARSGGSAGLNGTLSYSYDDAGNITSRSLPDSTSSSYGFDDDGRLTTITSAGATTTLAYDATGNLTSTTLPSGNGHAETRSYDRAGRLTLVDNSKAGTILSKHLWTLDAVGNPTKAQTTRGATDVYDVYEYDTRNRLTQACYDLASSATNCTGATNAIAYAYDKVSSRTQEIRAGNVGNTGTIDYTYNAADQLTSTTKSGDTTTYTYDANGNQATIGGRSFTYNLAGRLTSTTLGGTTTSYVYDGDGRRVSSTTSGGADLRYVWDPLAASGIPEIALEREAGGAAVRRYLGGPLGAISFTNVSATFYFHRDPLRSIVDVTDASGNAQWRYAYDAYGSARTATDVSGSAPANPVRFNGQYLDVETTQYHLRARQYDPTIGRFGALDPVENEPIEPYSSSYGYVGGRPTVFDDPLGLCRKNPFSRDFWSRGNCLSDGASKVGRGAQNIVEDAVRDFEDCGGSWQCAYHSFNENFNPMFKVLVSSERCGASGFDARVCAALARDIALAGLDVVGGGVAGRCVGQVLQRVIKRLGEKWGPQLQRLLREERGGTAGKSLDTYVDITKGRSIRNVGTSATHNEFADTLSKGGWTVRTSKDGKVQIFSKNGAKYVLREGADSYNGWTADFYAPGSSKINLKIRLDYK